MKYVKNCPILTKIYSIVYRFLASSSTFSGTAAMHPERFPSFQSGEALLHFYALLVTYYAPNTLSNFATMISISSLVRFSVKLNRRTFSIPL